MTHFFVFCPYSSLFLIELDNDRPAGVEICALCTVPNIEICVSEIFRKNICGSYSLQMIKAHKSS